MNITLKPSLLALILLLLGFSSYAETLSLVLTRSNTFGSENASIVMDKAKWTLSSNSTDFLKINNKYIGLAKFKQNAETQKKYKDLLNFNQRLQATDKTLNNSLKNIPHDQILWLNGYQVRKHWREYPVLLELFEYASKQKASCTDCLASSFSKNKKSILVKSLKGSTKKISQKPKSYCSFEKGPKNLCQTKLGYYQL